MRLTNKWNEIAEKIEAQTLKQKYYDSLLFDFCGDIHNKGLLDFGCGTGEIALRAKELGSEVRAYDPAEKMRELTSKKIGKANVYEDTDKIQSDLFDIVFSNLVICTVNNTNLESIMSTMRKVLMSEGTAYVGFCNPLNFRVEDTALQIRLVNNFPYETQHMYKKIIKEGDFEIIEYHRPIGFYEQTFVKHGFVIDEVRTSKEYGDFVIYRLINKRK